MRITAQVLEVEAIIGELLRDVPGWTVWADVRGARRQHRPTFLAVHTPTRRCVAVYCRPRRLYPSELPAVDWLPATIEPVVWFPGLRAEIRSWLTVAVGEPPGAVLTTRPGVR